MSLGWREITVRWALAWVVMGALPAWAGDHEIAVRALQSAEAGLSDAEWDGAQAEGDVEAVRACQSRLRIVLAEQKARAAQLGPAIAAGEARLTGLEAQVQQASASAEAQQVVQANAQRQRDTAAAALEAAQKQATADFENSEALHRALAAVEARKGEVVAQGQRVLRALTRTQAYASAQAKSADEVVRLEETTLDNDAGLGAARAAVVQAGADVTAVREDFAKNQLPHTAAVAAAQHDLDGAQAALDKANADAQVGQARRMAALVARDALGQELGIERAELVDATARVAQLQADVEVVRAAEEAAAEHLDLAGRKVAEAIHECDEALGRLQRQEAGTAQGPVQPVADSDYWAAHPHEADLHIVELIAVPEMVKARVARETLETELCAALGDARLQAQQRAEERWRIEDARHGQVNSATGARFLAAAPTIVLPQIEPATQPSAAK